MKTLKIPTADIPLLDEPEACEISVNGDGIPENPRT